MHEKIESLEPRRLMSVTFTGYVFQDNNNDGVFTAGVDAKQAGRTVYADDNFSYARENNEPYAVTGDDGTYTLTLPTGDHTVRQITPPGSTIAPRAPDAYSLINPADGTVFTANFASVIVPGSVSGSVFNDLNGNGVNDGGNESALPVGVTTLPVFVDVDNDGIFTGRDAYSYVNGKGNFLITGVLPGTYNVYLKLADNTYDLKATTPAGPIGATVVGGQTTAIAPIGVRRGFAVIGTIFDDVDGNGYYGGGAVTSPDGTYAGRTVYDDVNDNGQLDSGETSTTSLADGSYKLTLFAGPHTVREVLPANYVESSMVVSGGIVQGPGAPAAKSLGAAINLVDSTSATAPVVSFASYDATLYGAASGGLFGDANGNGVQDNGETTYAAYGTGVYLDLDNSNTHNTGDRSAYTGGTGLYRLQRLKPGTYTVRLDTPEFRLYQTSPANKSGITFTVTAGQTTVLPFFGVQPAYSVYVNTFYDVNADGILQTTETSRWLNRTVYDDANNNGQLDAGESSVVTGTGGYGYLLLPAGDHTLRQVVPGGYRGTGQSVQSPGATSTFHTDAVLHLPADGTSVSTYFGSIPGGTASIRGTVYNDINYSEDREPYENGMLGRYVFLDTNNNGVSDNGEFGQYTASDGVFSFTGLFAGTYHVRLAPAGNMIGTNPAGGVLDVTLATNEARTGLQFGTASASYVTVTGRAFYDADRGGTFTEGDYALGGDVYVDTNANGYPDDNDVFHATVSRLDGTYTLRLPADGKNYRLVFDNVTGYTATTAAFYDVASSTAVTLGGRDFGVGPVLGSVSGFCFDDSDKDGVFDSTEKKTSGKTVFLDANNNGKPDAGEKSTVTLADGSWAFVGLAAGTYRVRRVFPSGYSLSTTPIDVNLSAGQVLANLAIGSRSGTVTPPNTASITGSVFNDNNKNGKYDSGDGYAKGVVVFLDTDNDGKLDANETSVTTDSSGKFAFTKLAAGAYHVRRVLPSGYAYSTTKPDVTLTSGQAKSGVLIGTKKA